MTLVMIPGPEVAGAVAGLEDAGGTPDETGTETEVNIILLLRSYLHRMTLIARQKRQQEQLLGPMTQVEVVERPRKLGSKREQRPAQYLEQKPNLESNFSR